MFILLFAVLILLADLVELDLATVVFLGNLLVGAVVSGNFGRIDLENETPITLAKAARTLPGGPVHVSTIHRWRMKGCRGVRLETFLRGGVRHTTREALERFFTATTAAADGNSPTVRTSKQREQAIQQAEQACDRAGI
ncbi:MAG: DUF1580 domain-containing protein [bacterium]|nr:DUF1580 domain-containing protein [bacterium]